MTAAVKTVFTLAQEKCRLIRGGRATGDEYQPHSILTPRRKSRPNGLSESSFPNPRDRPSSQRLERALDERPLTEPSKCLCGTRAELPRAEFSGKLNETPIGDYGPKRTRFRESVTELCTRRGLDRNQGSELHAPLLPAPMRDALLDRISPPGRRKQ